MLKKMKTSKKLQREIVLGNKLVEDVIIPGNNK